MARESRADRESNVHSAALAEFNRIQMAQRDERLQCLQDRRFYSIPGAMWEGWPEQQWANRPRLEVNKIHLSVIRIINEYRNNRFAVEFINKDGTPNSPIADACNGLFRADEQDSCAQEAYDNAFEEAVGGGFGAFRLRAVYEDEDDEREYQRIVIEPIVDADSCVFFDLNAKRQDKADAKHCFVLYAQTRHDFEDEWGVDPATMPKSVHQTEFDWCTPDLVYIAEYYKVEKSRDVEYTFRHLDGSEETVLESEIDAEEDILKDIRARGARKVKTREIKTRRVHKYIMSGDRILEDCGYIAGKCIPIIPVYGKRWFVDGIERCMGQVRLAKDAQRIKNMQLSAMAELSALSPRQKPMFLPEQVAGHELMWARDNLDNNPFLLVNPITDANGQVQPAGPVAFTQPPNIPPAMAALMQVSEADMKEILGNANPEMEKMVSNISGKAVEQIQERVDGQAFIYMDNFASAIRRCGEVWKSMAEDVYVEPGRKLKAIGSMGDVSSLELKRPILGENGIVERENDLGAAKFDVSVSIGPTSRSRKQAAHRNIMEMLAICTDPQTQAVLQSLAFVNMDGEGISDVQEYFRKKLVSAGVMRPTDEERQQMEAAAANEQPSPQDQALLAMAEAEKAKAAKARADTLLTVQNAQKARAETDRTQAETVQILSDAQIAPDRLALEAAKTISGLMPKAEPPPA